MKVRTLVTAALLIAVGVILSFIIDVPILPNADFLKYTPADIPTLLGSFALGPVFGALIAFFRALIHGLITGFKNGPVGFAMDAVSSMTMAGVAGIIYLLHKTRKGALLALLAGALTMIIIATAVNYFWSYPAYGLPAEMVWATALPFNLIKCTLNSVITFLLYKPLSAVLHGRKD